MKKLFVALLLPHLLFCTNPVKDFYDAAGTGNLEILQKMISQGADVNGKYKEDPPLKYAAKHGQTEAVEYLLKNKADVDAQDDIKRTALMDAARFGKSTVVELLLEWNATVDTRDNTGKTALNYALAGKHKIIMYLLLKKSQEQERIKESSDKLARRKISDIFKNQHENFIPRLKQSNLRKGKFLYAKEKKTLNNLELNDEKDEYIIEQMRNNWSTFIIKPNIIDDIKSERDLAQFTRIMIVAMEVLKNHEKKEYKGAFCEIMGGWLAKNIEAADITNMNYAEKTLKHMSVLLPELMGILSRKKNAEQDQRQSVQQRLTKKNDATAFFELHRERKMQSRLESDAVNREETPVYKPFFNSSAMRLLHSTDNTKSWAESEIGDREEPNDDTFTLSRAESDAFPREYANLDVTLPEELKESNDGIFSRLESDAVIQPLYEPFVTSRDMRLLSKDNTKSCTDSDSYKPFFTSDIPSSLSNDNKKSWGESEVSKRARLNASSFDSSESDAFPREHKNLDVNQSESNVVLRKEMAYKPFFNSIAMRFLHSNDITKSWARSDVDKREESNDDSFSQSETDAAIRKETPVYPYKPFFTDSDMQFLLSNDDTKN